MADDPGGHPHSPRAEAAMNAANATAAESSAGSAKEAIRSHAETLGIDAVGFAAAGGDQRDRRNLGAYLAEGRHGDMAWMATTADRRADPQVLWPPARTVIAAGVNYGPTGNPLALHRQPERGTISVYAQGKDYHAVLATRLKALARWIARRFHCEVKIFVDTAPVMEKPLAQRAGIGWIGKHTNLVSRRFGSWLFLGEIFTTLELSPDVAHTDLCGSCDRCLAACPTGALAEPYRIEPRRCISYLTIEHKGAIEETLRPRLGNRVYGCDDCLAVCPWNRFAESTPHAALRPRIELRAPRLADLLQLDEPGFRELTAGTAMKRSGRDRLLRNVAVAAGNSGIGDLAAAAAAAAESASPVVGEAARWAERRLGKRAAGGSGG
jgi:epoxyqueuosine reductase